MVGSATTQMGKGLSRFWSYRLERNLWAWVLTRSLKLSELEFSTSVGYDRIESLNEIFLGGIPF